MALETWLAFLLASILISISPGAGAVNTMSNGLRYGISGSMPAILGLQLGYLAQIVLVGIGLGALLATSQWAFELVRWFGVAYLVWLGYQKWTQPLLDMSTADAQQSNKSQQFWQAAVVNISNPKATVFLLALFPQFANPNASHPAEQYLLMGSTLVVVDIIVMIGFAGLAAQLKRWMNSDAHQRLQNRIFGGLFIGAAGAMASYHRG
ncbi:homoserine/homoserine lactone efflux protein [Bacterioplanes sanyensis]|uniref:Homoserine/homoserine lactone efflux protein n=1 Tax=Bacterioplanes sanyensis TaxID=1249553 RepID=A0A222FHT3_9GAMM|nr:homoserine/homoserine lactone efflux protein [Bacterioplanes sanyensis]ASP37971.1 homoserine/homoserine lactone efflux protein [Bacterioplanes sanyensis]